MNERELADMLMSGIAKVSLVEYDPYEDLVSVEVRYRRPRALPKFRMRRVLDVGERAMRPEEPPAYDLDHFCAIVRTVVLAWAQDVVTDTDHRYSLLELR